MNFLLLDFYGCKIDPTSIIIYIWYTSLRSWKRLYRRLLNLNILFLIIALIWLVWKLGTVLIVVRSFYLDHFVLEGQVWVSFQSLDRMLTRKSRVFLIRLKNCKLVCWWLLRRSIKRNWLILGVTNTAIWFALYFFSTAKRRIRVWFSTCHYLCDNFTNSCEWLFESVH